MILFYDDNNNTVRKNDICIVVSIDSDDGTHYFDAVDDDIEPLLKR